MPWIELTRGYKAQVSEEDFERLSAFKWFATGNVLRIRAARKDGKMRYMHHEVLDINTADLNGKVVDHIDRDPLNNTRENLRVVPFIENMRNTNRVLAKTGVCFHKATWTYLAYLDPPGGPRKYLGYHKTREMALNAVAEARNALD